MAPRDSQAVVQARRSLLSLSDRGQEAASQMSIYRAIRRVVMSINLIVGVAIVGFWV